MRSGGKAGAELDVAAEDRGRSSTVFSTTRVVGPDVDDAQSGLLKISALAAR